MRQADGRITRVRKEESTREVSKTRATRVAADIAQYYHEQAYRPKAKASPSFTDAAITYVESKNPSKRDKGFAAKLVAHFGETPIADIDQASIANAAQSLYPGCSAATHSRAVYAPVITILRLSKERPDFRRPRADKKPLNVPPEGWFDAVLPHCDNRLAALLIFLTLTGRRITEALEAIDNGDGTATIERTKTGNAIVVTLPVLCRDLLYCGADNDIEKGGQRLFPYGDRHNVYRALRAACKRAGVPYYGTHALGRHAFATRLLKDGWSVKHVAAAGGWKSPKMVLERYGHLEQSEVANDVKELGDRWGRMRKKAGKVKKNKR